MTPSTHTQHHYWFNKVINNFRHKVISRLSQVRTIKLHRRCYRRYLNIAWMQYFVNTDHFLLTTSTCPNTSHELTPAALRIEIPYSHTYTIPQYLTKQSCVNMRRSILAISVSTTRIAALPYSVQWGLRVCMTQPNQPWRHYKQPDIWHSICSLYLFCVFVCPTSEAIEPFPSFLRRIYTWRTPQSALSRPKPNDIYTQTERQCYIYSQTERYKASKSLAS
jgi:hypothetical protein